MNDAEIALSWKLRCEELGAALERLHLVLDNRDDEIRRLEAEVEGLRAELRGARLVFPEYDTLKDEVERLRATMNAEGIVENEALSVRLRQSEAEVERLRAEPSRETWRKWMAAEAEVERLRAALGTDSGRE